MALRRCANRCRRCAMLLPSSNCAVDSIHPAQASRRNGGASVLRHRRNGTAGEVRVRQRYGPELGAGKPAAMRRPALLTAGLPDVNPPRPVSVVATVRHDVRVSHDRPLPMLDILRYAQGASRVDVELDGYLNYHFVTT